MYLVLENDGQKKTPPKEIIPADKDAPPVPDNKPVGESQLLAQLLLQCVETSPTAQLSLKLCMLR